MAFASNLAAINAANAQLKAAYALINPLPLDKDALKAARNLHFSIEKHDAEWHALIIAPFPIPQAPRDPAASLADERSMPAFQFPIGWVKAMESGASASEALENAQSPFSDGQANLSQAPIDSEGFVIDDAAKLQAAADALANEQALKDAQQAPKAWIHSSSVMKPTKLVWAIADEMLAKAASQQLPVPSRKEVQDECIRRGVASGTARTQYQAWKTARDNALKNAEHAAALSAAFNKR